MKSLFLIAIASVFLTNLAQAGTQFNCAVVESNPHGRIESFSVLIPSDLKEKAVSMTMVSPDFGSGREPFSLVVDVSSNEGKSHYVVTGDIVHPSEQESYRIDGILHRTDENAGVALITLSWDWLTDLSHPQLFKCKVAEL